MDLSGVVVLFTGAASEIAAAAAIAFDRAGARVALATAEADGGADIAARLGDALVLPTDMAQVDQARHLVEQTIERFGRIDVVINGPAIANWQPSDRLGADDVRSAMDRYFVGPMAATQAAVPSMRRRGRGQIINITTPAYLLGYPMLAPYTASTAALSSWTRVMQAEWYGTGIIATEYFTTAIDFGREATPAAGEFARCHLARLLTRPQTVEAVAEHLLACVRKPRPFAYANPTVRLACWAGLWTGVRTRLGADLATAVRERTGLPLFSSRPRHRPAVREPAPQSEVAAVAKVAEGTQPPTMAEFEPAPQPAVAQVEPIPQPSAAAEKASAAKPTRKRAPAAKKPAAAAKAGKAAAVKKPGAAASAAKPPAKKATARRGGSKSALLSPEATERVRAAAQRAAVAARAQAPAAKTKAAQRPAGDKEGGESSDS